MPGDSDGIGEAAEEVGFPLLVKAAAGGGGIGMRRVDAPDGLAKEVANAQSLAARSFADGTVYLERYVSRARHVEVQVFGFGDGAGVHLFERDCSVQRRYQKVIEEAPAPGLPQDIRLAMREAALPLVHHQRYRGAGTVEFIYEPDRREFFFLEMNTRIQVEHAVTEMITGIDLVRWQIELAAGTPAPVVQEAVMVEGAAVECRIYAERPEKRFLPAPGELGRFRVPEGEADVRVDSGVREGDRITPHASLRSVAREGDHPGSGPRSRHRAHAHRPRRGRGRGRGDQPRISRVGAARSGLPRRAANDVLRAGRLLQSGTILIGVQNHSTMTSPAQGSTVTWSPLRIASVMSTSKRSMKASSANAAPWAMMGLPMLSSNAAGLMPRLFISRSIHEVATPPLAVCSTSTVFT